MGGFLHSRYRNLILSLIIFLILITALFGFNYRAMSQASYNASVLDGVGELSDEFYNLNLHTQKWQIAQTPEEKRTAMNAVITSRRIIDKYMELFATGGDYHYPDGRVLYIPKLEDDIDSANYQELKVWLDDYEKQLDALSVDGDVAPLAQHIYTSKDRLYRLFDNIWTHQIEESQHWGKQAKTTLLAGIVLVFLYLSWFVFYFLRKLSQSDDTLRDARRQTSNILSTVKEGLFLIDKDFVISDAYSKSLESILHRQDIAGHTLLDLLKDMISSQDINATKMFIKQLYNWWVVPELIEDLNPLKKVRVGFLNEEGEPVVKYLSFTFLRVQAEDEDEDAEVEQIFVNVVDVTDSALLEQTLVSEKAQHDRQMEMMGYILNIDIRVLNQFIASTYERVDDMNEILRNDGQLHNKAQTLLRKMHALKGEASAIKMDSFVQLAERGETELTILRKQSMVAGQDFLGFAVVLNDLLDLTQFVEKLLERLAKVAQTQNQVHAEETLEMVDSQNVPQKGHWETYFTDYVKEVATRHGKNVSLNITGFDSISMSEQTKKFVQDVGIQLLKNAVVHGIETPEGRRAVGKTQTGQITLMLSHYGNQLRMSVIDDGAGVDVEALRQKAVDLGIVTAEAMAGVPDEKIYPLMFRSGLSTVTLSEDAGRGVGMDVVRDWVKVMNGKVQIDSKRGANTKITINFDPN